MGVNWSSEKPRTAENKARSKEFRIHPDIVVQDESNTKKNNGQNMRGNSSPNSNSKHKKLRSFTIVKKVFVDENGLLLEGCL
jgi:hypothetical protein